MSERGPKGVCLNWPESDLVRVTFPGGSVSVKRGTILSRALNLDGLRLETPCGGKGRCRKCLVRVVAGEAPVSPRDKELLWPEEIAMGYRLACSLAVESDITVSFKQRGQQSPEQRGNAVRWAEMQGEPGRGSLAGASDQPTDGGSADASGQPTSGGFAGTSGQPSNGGPADASGQPTNGGRGDASDQPTNRGAADSANESAAIRGPADASGEPTTGGPADASSDFRVWSPGYPHGEPASALAGPGGLGKRSALHADYGVAIDLGTTTITATLLRLSGGRAVATGSVPNPQAAFGADVMTRLELALRDPKERDRLQTIVLESIASLMLSVTRAAGICLDRVTDGILVGNSVMHHLALGFDVFGLARAPYRPSVTTATTIEFPGLPPLYAPPPVGGFVGSDAVAAIFAEGLHVSRQTRLLVDLGTNSEVALVHKGQLFFTSAPAGPAFEGAEISQGMTAAVGAIDSVQIEDGVFRVGVIGEGKPVGFCGSGLMDAVSALLATGLIDSTGRMKPVLPSSGTADPAVIGCVDGSGHMESRWPTSGVPMVMDLADSAGRVKSDFQQEPGGREPRAALPNGSDPLSVSIAPGVSITQKDIRAVQLAKGAVRAAIDALMSAAGCGPKDIDKVLLAGTFGSYVRPESAISLGLIPPVPVSRVMAVGNAALGGAKMMLGSRVLRDEAVRIARIARHISLCEFPGFEEVFMGSLNFPPKKESEAGV